ncbi:hypothetical protein KL944_000400 [Ogataea haglerorum]|nr:hypothetical protein KL944_000400 [Ogataea haglerorum]
MQISPRHIEFERKYLNGLGPNIQHHSQLRPRAPSQSPTIRKRVSLSNMDVSIIFQGLPKEPAIGTKCKDKFLIVSVPCSDDLDPKSVSTIWPELQSEAGSTTDVKVKVVFNYSSLTNTIHEESSQQSKSDDRDAAVLAAAPLANGHSGADEKPVSEKNAVNSDNVLQETMPAAPSTATNKEAAAAAAPAKQEPATSTSASSSNVYVVAALLVVLAVLYAKFLM